MGKNAEADGLEAVRELAGAAKALRKCRTLLVDAGCDADCGDYDDANDELMRAYGELTAVRHIVDGVVMHVDGYDSKDMLGDASWRLGVALEGTYRAECALATGDGPKAARAAGVAVEHMLAACGLLTLAAVGL